jgi:mono/diheme cytochrome c family protein
MSAADRLAAIRAARWTIAVAGCMLAAGCASRGTAAVPGPAATQAPTPDTVATSTAGAHGATGASTLSGVYTEDQAKRGQDVYAGRCRSCHTPASHTGPTFERRWVGKRLSDLYTYIITNMPNDDPGSLAPQDAADVVAYLLKLNAMPAGPAELYPGADSLEKIRIEEKGASKTSK